MQKETDNHVDIVFILVNDGKANLDLKNVEGLTAAQVARHDSMRSLCTPYVDGMTSCFKEIKSD